MPHGTTGARPLNGRFLRTPLPVVADAAIGHLCATRIARRKSIVMTDHPPAIGIIMGSRSDWETMRHAAETLAALGIAYEARVVSAHRTPQRLYDYATSARDRGLKVIIAGAGGAAHLPGMTAAMTPLPVLGVPVESRALSGLDSLLSIVQMPGGVPVGTLAIGKAGAINAGLLAASIIALEDPAAAAALDRFRADQTAGITEAPTDDTPVEGP
jgi:5-(carboxyamino)imidazole ribonucleotide mutase